MCQTGDVGVQKVKERKVDDFSSTMFEFLTDSENCDLTNLLLRHLLVAFLKLRPMTNIGQNEATITWAPCQPVDAQYGQKTQFNAIHCNRCRQEIDPMYLPTSVPLGQRLHQQFLTDTGTLPCTPPPTQTSLFMSPPCVKKYANPTINTLSQVPSTVRTGAFILTDTVRDASKIANSSQNSEQGAMGPLVAIRLRQILNLLAMFLGFSSSTATDPDELAESKRIFVEWVISTKGLVQEAEKLFANIPASNAQAAQHQQKTVIKVVPLLGLIHGRITFTGEERFTEQLNEEIHELSWEHVQQVYDYLSKYGFAGLGTKISDRVPTHTTISTTTTRNSLPATLTFSPSQTYLSALIDLLAYLISLAAPTPPTSTHTSATTSATDPYTNFTAWMTSHTDQPWHKYSPYIQTTQTWIKTTYDPITEEWVVQSDKKEVLEGQPLLQALAIELADHQARLVSLENRVNILNLAGMELKKSMEGLKNRMDKVEKSTDKLKNNMNAMEAVVVTMVG